MRVVKRVVLLTVRSVFVSFDVVNIMQVVTIVRMYREVNPGSRYDHPLDLILIHTVLGPSMDSTAL